MDWLLGKQNRYIGEVVDLVENRRYDPSKQTDYVVNVLYDIVLHGTDVKVGTCDLRIGMNEYLYYAGNIGYNVLPLHRGHGYAYEACRVLFEAARDEFHMTELIITCSPDNTPSRKTLEKLNGELLEVVEVPEWHWLNARGETVKNIYKYVL